MADASENPAVSEPGIPESVQLRRVALAAIGGLAGLCFWLLADVLEGVLQNPRAYLFVFAATAAFFAALLAMVGPLSLGRAARGALALALAAAGLLTWASLRFDAVGDFLETGAPLVAFGLIVSLLLPFVIAAQRPREGWRSYPALFNHAWMIVMRYAAAWLFVAIFWGVVMLSDALFQIVGLRVIDDLLRIAAVPYVLSGLGLGLAIAVVNEMSDYISPYLILRLLRLLLPVVLLVMAVFIVALPLNGLSGLFGGLSPATTLLAMALAGITLVSTALDRSDEEAVSARAMRLMTEALALLLPVVAGLAGYAVWQRVAQYGWTPDRLAAGFVAAVVLVYALAYAGAVVMRGGWRGRIRRVNTAMALAVVGGAALWLTPVLDPQRISTASQLARFEAGRTPVAALDLWAIGRQWGRAGQAGIARLAAITGHPEAALLQARLARLASAKTRGQFLRGPVVGGKDAAGAGAALQAVLRLLPVRPAAQPVQPAARPAGQPRVRAVLALLRPYQMNALLAACKQKTRQGNPGCVVVFADLLPRYQGDEAILLYRPGRGNLVWQGFYPFESGFLALAQRPDLRNSGAKSGARDDSVIDALIAGDYAVKPSEARVLRLKNATLSISP